MSELHWSESELSNSTPSALKGARTPPTQFFVDGCYARLLLFVYLQGLLHYNTSTKYLPKEPLTNFRANLEEISGLVIKLWDTFLERCGKLELRNLVHY